MAGFDYERPLIKKVLVRHPTKAQYNAGQRETPLMEIGMYKDEPGVFYDNQGRKIEESVATAPGGFTKEQVARYAKEAEKLEKIRAIEEQYRRELEKVDGGPISLEGEGNVSQTA